MRLRGLGILVGMLVAGAIALPAGATHEQITLHAESTHLALSDVSTGEIVPMRFSWSPSDTLFEGSSVLLCWNGRLDRPRLADDVQNWNELCSSGSSGLMGATRDEGSFTTATFDALTAGRYEAVIRRLTPCEGTCDPPPPPHWNVSNVVSVDVVDPCRLKLVSVQAQGFHFPLEVGSPMSCQTLINSGKLEGEGEDGSRFTLTGASQLSLDYITRNYSTDEPVLHPIFRLRAGGTPAEVTFSTGSRLGGLVTSVSTGAVHVLAVRPASGKLTFRKGVGHVHVTRGRVVVLGVGPYEAAWEIPRYCGKRKPTITCLSKMRYRFFTMKRGTSIKARVLRAGQNVTFKRRRGGITFLR
jgi:hypothetical protein